MKCLQRAPPSRIYGEAVVHTKSRTCLDWIDWIGLKRFSVAFSGNMDIPWIGR